MNFSLIGSESKDFNKLMMQKHLDQKRSRKHNTTVAQRPCNQMLQQSSRFKNTQSLPLAGQTLLNQNFLNNHSYVVRKKTQINEQNQKMKRLLKDNLQQSLAQQKDRKYIADLEQKRNRKIMSTENGVLDYLQKQIQKRDNFIKMCLVKQQMNKNKFIDQDLRKHRKVLQHIQQNYDADVFNHESDKYQQTQKLNFQKVLQTNEYQAQNQKMSRLIEKQQYRKYLDQKTLRERQRHNPITNPLEYHIQNPYIRKQLQKY